MTAIQIEDVSLRFQLRAGVAMQAESIFTFEVCSGEPPCLLGPSGCGRSTLLCALGDHIPLTSGCIRLAGEPLAGPSRRIGLVFQHLALFPWLCVPENIACGPRAQGRFPAVPQTGSNVRPKGGQRR